MAAYQNPPRYQNHTNHQHHSITRLMKSQRYTWNTGNFLGKGSFGYVYLGHENVRDIFGVCLKCFFMVGSSSRQAAVRIYMFDQLSTCIFVTSVKKTLSPNSQCKTQCEAWLRCRFFHTYFECYVRCFSFKLLERWPLQHPFTLLCACTKSFSTKVHPAGASFNLMAKYLQELHY